MEGEGGGPKPADIGDTGGKKAEAASAAPPPAPEAKGDTGGTHSSTEGDAPPLPDPLYTRPDTSDFTVLDDDLSSLGGAETDLSKNERARDIAGELFAQKASAIKEELGPDRKATGDEKAILWADYYKKGFPEDIYDTYGGTIPVENGLKITTSDDEELTITEIVYEREIASGEVIYTCTVDGQPDPLQLSGSALAEAHMEQNVDAIANNFTNASQKELAEWYAKGGTEALSFTDEQLEDIDLVVNPAKALTLDNEKRRDAVEDLVGDVLAQEIAKINSVLFATDENGKTFNKLTDDKERRQLEMHLAAMEAALLAKGEFGAIAQMAILMNVRELSNSSTTGIDRVLRNEDFLDDHDAAMKKFENFTTEKGLTPSQKEDLLKAIQNPEDFPKLLENGNETITNAAEEAMRGVFGHEPTDTEIDSLFDALIDANTAIKDASLKERIKKAFTENKAKKLGLLALILGAIPVVIAGAATIGAMEMAGSVGSAVAKG